MQEAVTVVATRLGQVADIVVVGVDEYQFLAFGGNDAIRVGSHGSTRVW